MAQAVIGMLKIALVLGLVVAWGFVLLPPLLRFFSGFGHRASSYEKFNGSMSRVGCGNPSIGMRAPAAMNSSDRPDPGRVCSPATKKRRRDILVGLIGTSVVTFLAALALGGKAWLLFLATAVLLGGYVYLLWSANQARLAARNNVTYLPQMADTTVIDMTDDRVHAVSR